MRPIDADALDELLKDCIARYKFVPEPIGIIRTDEINAIRDLIKEQMPTVDAVPVVRCKDCKYALPALNGFDEEGFGCSNEHTPGYESFWWFEPDWFCAGGERREE